LKITYYVKGNLFINIDNKIYTNNHSKIEINKNNITFFISKEIYPHSSWASYELSKRLKNITNEYELKKVLMEFRNYLEIIACKDNIHCAIAVGGIIKVENTIFSFNVGDIRIYRFFPKSFVLISKDHTYLTELYLNGKINSASLKDARQNIVTSFIASDKKGFDIFINKLELIKNDRFLIASDLFYENFETNFLEFFNCNKIDFNLLNRYKEIAFIFIEF